jgi:hypothetical protein
MQSALADTKQHVLYRFAETELGRAPFYHLFVEDVLPPRLYAELQGYMLACKHGGLLQERRQDNPDYVNRRFNLVGDPHPAVVEVQGVFSDAEVKLALLRKFYSAPTRALADGLRIHEEFEFVHCAAGLFQNIHVDIPSKFMSFVFYIPERPLNRVEEERNATVLYNRSLEPQYQAKFRANSVCVFVPHFHSYHGFASTMERDVLVMFYVNDAEHRRWQATRNRDEPPFTGLKDAIERKITLYPLIEYGSDRARIAEERRRCLVNAPKGRVMRDAEGRPLPVPGERRE